MSKPVAQCVVTIREFVDIIAKAWEFEPVASEKRVFTGTLKDVVLYRPWCKCETEINCEHRMQTDHITHSEWDSVAHALCEAYREDTSDEGFLGIEI